MKERTLRHLAAALLIFTAIAALAATGAELVAAFNAGGKVGLAIAAACLAAAVRLRRNRESI